MSDFYNKLQQNVAKEQILINEPMSRHTSFKIGGPCDYYILIKKKEELIRICELCKEERVPFFVIGNGSNLLVTDAGYRGVILRLSDQMVDFAVTEEKNHIKITASAGMQLSIFAKKAADLSCDGVAFAAGIPGTVGGAVYMNAGAYGYEIKDFLVSVEVISADGKIMTLTKEQLELGYRSSVLQQKDYYVISAQFDFEKGNKEEIWSKIQELNRQRREKQPLEYPSAGSTFKRPKGNYAGKLIMEAGLAGYRVGGAMVSEKHCGFVVNVGNATAQDVLILMEDVIRIIKEKDKITLEPEVRVIGEV